MGVRRILVAEEAGACYGVERALALAEKASSEATGPVHTLGPLIHNPRVVADLEAAGVTVVRTPSEAAGATLILRTHGVTPEVEREAREKCAKVIDATCPFVKKVHVAVERLSREGYQVVVVGEAGHPEVEATLGHAPGAVVVSSAAQATTLHARGKVGVVVQTTQPRALLAEVVDALIETADELRVFDTICEATSGHQSACADLARRADVMVVIGGRNSANTTHLAEIAAAGCARTHHVESSDELDPSWFIDAEIVGITAGASTPASQIEAVRTAIAGILGEDAS